MYKQAILFLNLLCATLGAAFFPNDVGMFNYELPLIPERFVCELEFKPADTSLYPAKLLPEQQDVEVKSLPPIPGRFIYDYKGFRMRIDHHIPTGDQLVQDRRGRWFLPPGLPPREQRSFLFQYLADNPQLYDVRSKFVPNAWDSSGRTGSYVEQQCTVFSLAAPFSEMQSPRTYKKVKPLDVWRDGFSMMERDRESSMTFIVAEDQDLNKIGLNVMSNGTVNRMALNGNVFDLLRVEDHSNDLAEQWKPFHTQLLDPSFSCSYAGDLNPNDAANIQLMLPWPLIKIKKSVGSAAGAAGATSASSPPSTNSGAPVPNAGSGGSLFKSSTTPGFQKPLMPGRL